MRLPTPRQPIALLPLDDRPCNRQFPEQLAAIVGQPITMPPRDALGWFTRPGDCDAIATWLRSLTPSPRGLATPSPVLERGQGGEDTLERGPGGKASSPSPVLERGQGGEDTLERGPGGEAYSPSPVLERGQGGEDSLESGVGGEARRGGASRLALSLDMLCYGGLVASRTLGADIPTALTRLSALRELRAARPDAIIFAFSVIMRLGRTVTSPADLEEHLLLRAYSQLLDRVERLGEADARAELERTQQQLDPGRLAGYIAVRRRNHAINRAAVDLVAEGVLDYLVLCQEDAAPVGIHLPEQLALRAQIQERRVGDRVVITSGADEMTMSLLARHITAEADFSPGLAVDLAAEAGGDVVPAFESQPLRETILDHLAICGARPAIPAEADAVLFVHTPTGSQPDIAEAPPPGQAPTLAMQAESVADRVAAASAAERLCGLADVAYCNGADPELIAALERRNALGGLGAFAGWNTAANTLGTVISQLCIMSARGRMVKHDLTRSFLASRLTDDYGYQTCARRRAIAHAEEIGANPFDLGDSRAELERFVNAELEPLSHRYVSQVLPDSAGDAVRVGLPWGRLFEVEVELGAPSSSADPKNLR
ncbi:MAG: DUF4127 family protein [Armatimonadota bacterium]